MIRANNDSCRVFVSCYVTTRYENGCTLVGSKLTRKSYDNLFITLTDI